MLRVAALRGLKSLRKLRAMISGRKCPYGAATLGDAIQELSKQWAISMLAFPEMANETRTTMGSEMATITEQENYWQYKRAVLLGVYAAGLFAALLCFGSINLLLLCCDDSSTIGLCFYAFLFFDTDDLVLRVLYLTVF